MVQLSASVSLMVLTTFTMPFWMSPRSYTAFMSSSDKPSIILAFLSPSSLTFFKKLQETCTQIKWSYMLVERCLLPMIRAAARKTWVQVNRQG